MDRQALRQQMKSKRQQLSPVDRIKAAQHLARLLETLPGWSTGQRIAGYWAYSGELPLNLAMANMAARQQTFFLPVIQPENRLVFAPWQQGDAVTTNHYGIVEPASKKETTTPEQLDIVLVPLIAFNRRGHRLGFGGGYYDRSFAFLKSQNRPATPLLVGVAYSFQEHNNLPAMPWDVALDYVATDQALIKCTEHTETTG